MLYFINGLQNINKKDKIKIFSTKRGLYLSNIINSYGFFIDKAQENISKNFLT